MNELNKMMSWLCWDIYLCSGIERSLQLRAKFAVMCWNRTKAAIQNAQSEEEALRLTEGMYDTRHLPDDNFLFFDIFIPLYDFHN